MSKKKLAQIWEIYKFADLALSLIYLHKGNSGLECFDYYITPSDPRQIFRNMREYKGKKSGSHDLK
jgi:hypothetical protein